MRDLGEFYTDVLGELGITGPDRTASGEDVDTVESRYPGVWAALNEEGLTSWGVTDDIPDGAVIPLAWIVAFHLAETFGVYGQKRESLRALGQVGGDTPSIGEQMLRRQASVDYIPHTLQTEYF
jgi:hypothetical protein